MGLDVPPDGAMLEPIEEPRGGSSERGSGK
jgi:hypothetical protein